MKNALYCEHANEMPQQCPCPADCYCKSHSCKGAAKGAGADTDLLTWQIQVVAVCSAIEGRDMSPEDALGFLNDLWAKREAAYMKEPPKNTTTYCPDCKLPAHLCGSHTGKGCEGHWVQCTSVYQGTPRNRDVTIRFCSRRKGHEGDHRGDRVQWNQKGEKVKITLPPDAR